MIDVQQTELGWIAIIGKQMLPILYPNAGIAVIAAIKHKYRGVT